MSADRSTIAIEVAPHPPRLAGLTGLRLSIGACVADALAALEIDAIEPAYRLGIWGRAASPATLLAEGDRVEFYRPLIINPKVARRARTKR